MKASDRIYELIRQAADGGQKLKKLALPPELYDEAADEARLREETLRDLGIDAPDIKGPQWLIFYGPTGPVELERGALTGGGE